MGVDPGKWSWNDVDKKLVYFKCLIDKHRPTWTPVELDPADSLSASESVSPVPSMATGRKADFCVLSRKIGAMARDLVATAWESPKERRWFGKTVFVRESCCCNRYLN
jgi:hypothetical protein